MGGEARSPPWLGKPFIATCPYPQPSERIVLTAGMCSVVAQQVYQ